MNKTPTCTSTSARTVEPSAAEMVWPVETEIYILPNGEIVVADLPQELAARLASAGLPPASSVPHVAD